MHCEIKQSAQDTLIYQFDLNTISCSDFGQLCDAINSFEEIGIKRGSLIYLGPDQNGITLEKGYKLMEEYIKNVKQLVHERGKLVNAQKLFGIEITVYPELNFVENYMNK
eukprot:185424_1